MINACGLHRPNTPEELSEMLGPEILSRYQIVNHVAGLRFVRETAMREVDGEFDIVVTTNSGYPLDLNLYQAVKGMSAAVEIVRQEEDIVIASECREGLGTVISPRS